MSTLWKALLITILAIVMLIALPILIALIGVFWPVFLIIAVIIFIPVLIAFVWGTNSQEKKED